MENTSDKKEADMTGQDVQDGAVRLKPYITPFGACAISTGSAIGWGSFVFTGNSYLLKAGTLGSVIGIIIGGLIMFIMARNYFCMLERYPEAGGVYAYVTGVFGHDRAFLVSWFLFLTYMSVFWANATSLPLFAGNFFGDMFKFGLHYTIAGYEVWLGEALISVLFIVLSGIICMKYKKSGYRIAVVSAVVFTAGLAVCLFAALCGMGAAGYSMAPGLIPDKRIAPQIIGIACMAPWAFVGFENISHSAAEFDFPRRKTFGILSFAVLITSLLYIAIILLSVSAYPEGYNSWLEYIADVDNISGLNRYPAFHAAERYLGYLGIAILAAVLFALIISSLIGMIIAVSRLLYAIAGDGIIPEKYAALNEDGVPEKAIGIIMLISVFVPFIGRTAIGWIVDVTTIGTILVYCFVSAAAYKVAKLEYDRIGQISGIAGIVIMAFLAAVLQFPGLTGDAGMAKESYFLFTVWGVLGFLFFRWVVSRDRMRRFGNSIVVWIGMLALVLFTALVWMSESAQSAAEDTINEISAYYKGQADDSKYEMLEKDFIEDEIRGMKRVTAGNGFVLFGLFVLSTVIVSSNYQTMKKREKENDEALGVVQNMAYRDQLTGVKSKHAYAEKEESMNLRIKQSLVAEFAIVVCDVNGLKQINDTLGHKAGDEYIKTACMMICKLFKHSPVFRIGGDEFVVVMEGEDYANRLHLMAELESMVENNNKVGGVVVAAGLTDYDSSVDTSFRQVFDRADSIMYLRKKELKSNS